MEEIQSENTESTQDESGIKKQLTTVTTLSKYLALLLFIALPFIGGWIGYTYAPEKVVEVERVVMKEVVIEKAENVAEVPNQDASEGNVKIFQLLRYREGMGINPDGPGMLFEGSQCTACEDEGGKFELINRVDILMPDNYFKILSSTHNPHNDTFYSFFGKRDFDYEEGSNWALLEIDINAATAHEILTSQTHPEFSGDGRSAAIVESVSPDRESIQLRIVECWGCAGGTSGYAVYDGAAHSYKKIKGTDFEWTDDSKSYRYKSIPKDCEKYFRYPRDNGPPYGYGPSAQKDACYLASDNMEWTLSD